MWTYAAVDNPGELYLRSLALTVGFFVAMTAIPDRRQVAADRQVEGGGHPDLEPALLPLLGG